MMGSPRRSQRHMKRDVEGISGMRIDRAGDDDGEGSEKRKQKSGKPKKSDDREDIDVDTSGKRKSSVERHASRKRSLEPSQVDSDEDEYDSRKQYSKQAKKKQEESTLEMLSHWYQDGEVDGKHDRLDESQRNNLRKSSSKFIEYEGSQNRGKNKEGSHDDDYIFSERSESHEKSHEYSDQDKNAKKIWDGKTEDSEKSELRSRKTLDSSERSSRFETGEDEGRTLESSSEREKSYEREEGKVNLERIKSRSRFDASVEGIRSSSLPIEDISGKERSQNPRDIGHPRRSKTPETRCGDELGKSESDHVRGSGLKRKELDRDVQVSEKVKTGDESSSEKNRVREGSKESYKRKQSISNDRDLDSSYDRDREWDFPRRGRDRMDSERPSGRSGSRNDIRGVAVKASNDVIEIQPKPLDYGRGDLATAYVRRNDVGQSDLNTAANDLQADQNRLGGHASVSAGDKDKGTDDGLLDQNAWKDDADSQGVSKGQKVPIPGRISISQPPYGNQESGSLGRSSQSGGKGGRIGRPNRVRPPGRDNQQMNMNLPLMPPFGPLSMPPPGPISSMNPNMSPGPGPGIPPGVFVPPFSPNMWPGARTVDLSVLPASPGMSPFPSGPPGQRFGPNIGNPPNSVMFYNQPGRGMPPNVSGSGFNAMTPSGRGQSIEKVSGGWVPPKGNAPPGKAPSRGEQNDYSQNFVDTGMRPQNFIRELELTNVEDYPKLRELIQKKDEIVDKASSAPMYYKADLREFVLSPEFFATKFDVILVDPPWEEYVHRAAGVTDHMESWTFEEIMNIKIEAIADTPSFIFLWVGDGIGLEQGRQCLKKWGFRRCEDICWVKTNKNTATPSLRHSNTLFQHSKEHCLMGIKGTVRRSTDGHIIHANIDTDVIIAEEPPYGSTKKPDEIYRIIEHFALGRRRIELFGEDHNIRPGWLTVGKGLSSSNFNSEAYIRNFSDKDGKVWQGGGGRNPPPEAPHLVQTTPEIESLRPKSPMKNQQQLQQQSSSISLTAASSSGRKPPGNSPQTSNPFVQNPDASAADHLAPPWGPMDGMRGREAGNLGPRDSVLDMYGYNVPPPMLPNGEFMDFDARRSMNLM